VPPVRAVRVPTEVNELATTVLLRVAPLNVPAAAVTVIAAEPLKSTPLIALAVAKVVAVAGETFILNDKFSFNGFGAAAYTEPMNSAALQTPIAQQGGTLQRYRYIPLDTDVDCDIHVTFIDQNNA
jgi:hypothetical protein